MKLLIHDLESKDSQKLFPNPLDETMVILYCDVRRISFIHSIEEMEGQIL